MLVVSTNGCRWGIHHNDVIMSSMAFQITSLAIVYSAVYSGADQRKHQSSAWLAFVWGIHRGPVNSPHKWPVTRKMFPFDDAIMFCILDVNWNFLQGWCIFYILLNTKDFSMFVKKFLIYVQNRKYSLPVASSITAMNGNTATRFLWNYPNSDRNTM